MAPVDVTIHYLTLFKRAFNATEEAALRNDPDAMLFCGYLADSLHNVPSMLRNYGEDRWNTPEWIAESVDGLLPRCEEFGAPPPVLTLCRQITRDPILPAELDLEEGGQFDLAPEEALSRYLRLLKDFCLSVRMIRSAGEPPHGWNGLAERWDDCACRAGRANGKLAALLRPLPRSLVHWDRWDEAAFWKVIWEQTRSWPGDAARQYWEPF